MKLGAEVQIRSFTFFGFSGGLYSHPQRSHSYCNGLGFFVLGFGFFLEGGFKCPRPRSSLSTDVILLCDMCFFQYGAVFYNLEMIIIWFH